jgi:pentatricopeptide repeat protein
LKQVQGAFESGKYGHALALFDQLRQKDKVQDTACYHVVLQKVLGLKGDVNLALALLEEMKQEHDDPMSLVVLGSHTYNIVLNGMASRVRQNNQERRSSFWGGFRGRGEEEDVELLLPMDTLYLEMLRRGLSPDGHTYSAMIKGCVSAKDEGRALLHLDNMLVQMAQEVEEEAKERAKGKAGTRARAGAGTLQDLHTGGNRGVHTQRGRRRMTHQDVQVCASQVVSLVGQSSCNNILRQHQATLDVLAQQAKQQQRRRQHSSSPSPSSSNSSTNPPSRTTVLSMASLEKYATHAKEDFPHLLLQLCRTHQDFELAHDLYTAMLEYEPDAIDLVVQNALLHGLCHDPQGLARATELFQSITKDADRRGMSYQPRPQDKAPTASEYFNKDESSRIETTLGERPLLKNQADAVTYTTMVRGLLYNHHNNDHRKSDHHHHHKNNTAAPLSLLLDGTECDHALSLFQDMERLGIPRDRESFHTLITGLCHNGVPERAWDVFEEMGDVGLRDTAAYTTMIQGFISTGDLPVAQSLFEEMEEDETSQRDIAVYDTLMQGYLKQGELEQAWSIFEAADTHHVERDASIYASMIGGLCHHYERSMEEERKRKFQSHGLDGSGNKMPKPPLLSILPQVRVRSNLLLSDALALFEEMSTEHLERDVQVYTKLIKALCRAGRVDEAWSMFQSMKEERVAVVVEGNGGNGGNGGSLGGRGHEEEEEEEREQGVQGAQAAQGTQGAQGNVATMDETQYRTVPMHIDAIAYTNMLRGLCQVGQLDRAVALFHEMGLVEAKEKREQEQHHRQTAEPLRVPPQQGRRRPFVRDVAAYTALISGLVQQTHRLQASDDGSGAGTTSNGTTSSNNTSSNTTSSGDGTLEWAKAGGNSDQWLMGKEEHQRNIEHAWALFENLRRSGSSADMDTRVHATMLSGLARLDDGLGRAEALFLEMERLPHVRVDGQAYRAMVEAGCNAGATNKAIVYFEDMLSDWFDTGIQDRDFAVVERLLVEHLSGAEWGRLVEKHKEAIEGIALGPGNSSMVKLSDIFRKKFTGDEGE